MKTIKDYEKEFDEKDFYSCEEFEVNGFIECECKLDKEQIKNYIFQELLPQVLSDMIIINTDCIGYPDLRDKRKYFNLRIKQKAKEMGIKL